MRSYGDYGVSELMSSAVRLRSQEDFSRCGIVAPSGPRVAYAECSHTEHQLLP
jgi:hypothetical protein